MSHMVLCSACKRHVRVAEERCPFCAAAIAPEARAAVLHPAPARGLSRAKVYAFHAALAAGVAAGAVGAVGAVGSAGCENENTNTNDTGGRGGSVVASQGGAGGNGKGGSGQGGSGQGGSGQGGSGQGGSGQGGRMVFPPYGCVFPCDDGTVKV